jgi:TIR domain
MKSIHESGPSEASNQTQQRVEDLLDAPVYELIHTVAAAVSTNEATDHASDSKPIRVFLSYARPDEAVVSGLFDKLASDGFSPWMDVRNILPGENWPTALYRALDASDFFVFCLSRHSLNRRGFLQREIRAALDKILELLDDDIYLIPVRLEACGLPNAVSKYQAVDLFEPGGYQKLLSGLRTGASRRERNGSDYTK